MKIFHVIILLISAFLVFLIVRDSNKSSILKLDFLAEFQSSTTDEFQKQINERGIELEDRGRAPDFVGLDGWLNSEPLSLDSLKGKVVLVDFWTFSCINCIRTLPYLNEWHSKYKDHGLVIAGIHTPEFAFEKEIENLKEAMEKYGIKYPVAQDNDYETWNAYVNRYWPAEYLIDANGHVRYTHFGEGAYDITEGAIRRLLEEAGYDLSNVADINQSTSETDFSAIGTPEIYLGASRLEYFGNPPLNEFIRSEVYSFNILEENIDFNNFYLEGKWKFEPEYVELVEGPGKIVIKYKASKVNMVFVATEIIDLKLKLDGKDVTENNKGWDVTIENGEARVEIRESDLYNLIDTGDDYDTHILEIIIPESGLRAFAFTFG